MIRPNEGTARFPAPDYIWVHSAGAYQKMLGSLIRAERLALDIEADSLYHYFEKVCLIQISTNDETFVLDPLEVRDIQELAPILKNPEVEKVLHAAAYDILSLRRDYGFIIRSLFDTHIAAQLLGYEQLGLDTMLETLLGVVHSKHFQRDDWSRRPLAPEQLAYAATDTHHLLALRDLLEDGLRAKGRLAWAHEEFQCASETVAPERQFDPEGYLRLKSNRDLSAKELSILRSLYLLRDRYARVMDTPPFKVINNSVLVDLALTPPASPGELSRRPGISNRVARNFSAEIFHTIARAANEPLSPRPAATRTQFKPMSKSAKARLARLKAWRQSKALALALPVGVVFPGNLLEALAASPPDCISALRAVGGMRAWRVEEFGAEVLDVLCSIQ